MPTQVARKTTRRTPGRETGKPATKTGRVAAKTGKPAAKTAKVATKTPHWLASFRCMDNGVVTTIGFARTLTLSLAGALLETADALPIDQVLALEFLVENDRILRADGVVARVTQSKGMYHVAVTFPKLSAQAKRLLTRPARN